MGKYVDLGEWICAKLLSFAVPFAGKTEFLA
jgi:hypothetical protein